MNVTHKFSGKVAVITGSGSGIGEALAKHASSLGMKVVVAELSRERGESVANAINEEGGEALFVETNVTQYASLQRLADVAYDHFGDVDLLVNNAGISVMGKSWEVSPEEWDRSIDVNFRGAVYGVRAFVPRMIESGGPRYICNLGSLASFSMATKMSPYFNTKHATMSFTECLFLEMQEDGHPIHVSFAVPDMIKTRIFEDTVAEASAGEAHQLMMKGLLEHTGTEPSRAAKLIFDGIVDERFVISTKPAMTQALAAQRSQYLADVHGNNPSPSDPGLVDD